MHEIFLGFLAQISQGQAVGALITIDSLVPIGALVTGISLAGIQIYNTTRNRAYDVQYDAIETRLVECERYRDGERRKLEDCRQALFEAHTRIAELESRYERGGHAGA